MPAAVLVRPCPDPKFGDYQTNALMALAKARKMNPRQLAADVAAKLDIARWCEPVEVAGAGFLNFRLKPAALADALREAAGGGGFVFRKSGAAALPLLLISARPTWPSRCTSATFARPFWAIRWRAFCGLLGHRVDDGQSHRRLGHAVRQIDCRLENAIWTRTPWRAIPSRKWNGFTKPINAACESDPQVLESARQELVKLQSGDEENLRFWRRDDRPFPVAIRPGLCAAGGAVRSHVRRELLQSATEIRGGGTGRARHWPSASEGAMAVFFDGCAGIEGAPGAGAKKRRRLQLHDHRSGHAAIPLEGRSWGDARQTKSFM